VTPLNALVKREIALAWSGGGPFVAVGFFAAVTTMLPLALGSSPSSLASVASGIAWIALTLSSLLSLDRMFERDFDNGILDLLSSSGLTLEVVAAVKCGAQWLVLIVPLSIVAPLGAGALGGQILAGPMIFTVALVGGMAFTFVGGAGAALALTSRRGGILIALIVLPLLTPPVIFGGSAIERVALGGEWLPSFALLCGYCVAAVGLAPFAMAAACRNAIA